MSDEYMLDPNEAGRQQKEGRLSSEGIICPKRNVTIGGKCHVCEALSRVFQSATRGDARWRLASSKAAKAAYFMNVVLPEDKSKLVLMQIGKEAGNVILSNIKKKKWLDIAHPRSGMGREMEITKSVGEGGYNKYSVQPVLDKADWDIEQDVLENLHNLDQQELIALLQEGVDFFKVSSLKTDETMVFRICPPWRNGTQGSENRRIMTAIFRHWGGITQAMVEGKEKIDLQMADDIMSGVTTEGVMTEPPAPEMEMESPISAETDEGVEVTKRKKCFGKEDFFEKDDPMCLSCPDHDECWEVVKEKVKGN